MIELPRVIDARAVVCCLCSNDRFGVELEIEDQKITLRFCWSCYRNVIHSIQTINRYSRACDKKIKDEEKKKSLNVVQVPAGEEIPF